MKIWMSGEVEADVADGYRELRKDVEKCLNLVLESKDYGRGLAKWSFIAMLLGDNSPDLREVKKYRKNDKTAEFRLIVDHGAFKAGDRTSRMVLLMNSLLRSLSFMEEMRVPDVNIGLIRSDLLAVARTHGWLP